MVPGIAVSSSPWRLWLQCLTLCRIRLCPPGPARRQQARLQVDRKKLPGRTRRELAHCQGSVNEPCGRRQWRGEGRDAGAPEGQACGAAGWGAALAAGESRLPLGEGPGTVATWHCVGNQHCPVGRVLAVRPAPRPMPSKALSAQCWEGEPGTLLPLRPWAPLLPPSTPSPCRVLMFADVRKWLFQANLVQGLLCCMWPRGLGMFHLEVSG